MADTTQVRQKADRPANGPVAGLIDGVYALELVRKLPLHGGGLPACAAQDRKTARANLMGVQARRGQPPRAKALAALHEANIAGLAAPLAHGVAPGPDGVGAYFVICQTPPGAPLGTSTTVARNWSEAELLACVLRPVAACLAELQARGVTHRAIRPDNLFQQAAGQKVTLGAAWAAPPASLQPAVFEPPYVGICLRSGRGDGSIADDVYALGVLLVALLTGAMPMAGLDDAEVVRRKLALGSFAAVTGERPLPPAIADLTRLMLAEDPEHRPSPAQLDDPEMARSRRLAARPSRMAQRPLEVQGQSVQTLRGLAGALATAPSAAAAMLRDGQVAGWLRRALGEATVASRLDEMVRARGESGPDDVNADALLVMRAVAVLDPLAPLCWRGLSFWPDGLGPALVDAEAPALAALNQAVATEAIGGWAALRPERCDPAALRVEARQHRAIMVRRGWAGGIAMLRYSLNPLTHCASRMLGRQLVVRVADLLPALELEAARPEALAGGPVDAEMAAFIVARQDLRLEREFAILADPTSAEASQPGAAALAQVQILARLQERVQAPPVLALATALAAALRPAFVVWQSGSRRRELEASLDARAATGRLEGLLELLDNPPLRGQDEREAADARAEVARIDATLASLRAQRDDRVEITRRIGQEAAAALGVIAASAVAMWLAL